VSSEDTPTMKRINIGTQIHVVAHKRAITAITMCANPHLVKNLKNFGFENIYFQNILSIGHSINRVHSENCVHPTAEISFYSTIIANFTSFVKPMRSKGQMRIIRVG
jgi:hypothetical protein